MTGSEAERAPYDDAEERHHAAIRAAHAREEARIRDEARLAKIPHFNGKPFFDDTNK